MKFSKNVNKYGRDIRGEESRHAIGPHQRCDLLLQTVKFEYSKLAFPFAPLVQGLMGGQYFM